MTAAGATRNTEPRPAAAVCNVIHEKGKKHISRFPFPVLSKFPDDTFCTKHSSPSLSTSEAGEDRIHLSDHVSKATMSTFLEKREKKPYVV
jgi:hypothetical protein